MVVATCELIDLAAEGGDALPEAHQAHEHALLQLEGVVGHTAAAPLALEGAVAVPAAARQLPRHRHLEHRHRIP